jgi:hypothetical protein
VFRRKSRRDEELSDVAMKRCSRYEKSTHQHREL